MKMNETAIGTNSIWIQHDEEREIRSLLNKFSISLYWLCEHTYVDIKIWIIHGNVTYDIYVCDI